MIIFKEFSKDFRCVVKWEPLKIQRLILEQLLLRFNFFPASNFMHLAENYLSISVRLR